MLEKLVATCCCESNSADDALDRGRKEASKLVETILIDTVIWQVKNTVRASVTLPSTDQWKGKVSEDGYSIDLAQPKQSCMPTHFCVGAPAPYQCKACGMSTPGIG